MKILGITGPTGAGKTTALQELKQMGALLIDADAVYHRMLKEDVQLRQELEEKFGCMTDENGEFDRKKLGSIVFRDSEALEALNKIAHRHIVNRIKTMLEQAEKEEIRLAAVDAIALFESGLDRLCHDTVAIIAPPQVRIRRIMDREGISEEYARMRVEAQQKDDFFTARCGHTLYNDCDSREEFAERAKELFAVLVQQ